MSWWKRLAERDRHERELDAELRYHVERRIDDLRRDGASDRDARRRARLEVGGVDQVKEACRDARGTRWLEELWYDTRHALRGWRRRPGFTAVALITLGLASGATTVMFTVVNGVLLTPLGYPRPDRLVSVHDQTDRGDGRYFSYLNFLDLRRDVPAFARIAAWQYGGGTVSNPGEAEYLSGLRASSDFFAVLGLPLIAGREFRPEEDQAGGAPVVVISEALWRRRFGGDLDALGRRLVLDGEARTIVGIAASAGRPIAGNDVFTPLGQNRAPNMTYRQARPGISVVGRLTDGVTLAAANTELDVAARDLAVRYPDANEGHRFSAELLQRDIVGDVRPMLWLLLGAVALVLLVACLNVASLLLARALSRDRELAMRAALGAARSRLVRQCLTESTALAMAGGLLGLAVAALGIRPFLAIWPGGLPRFDDVRMDWRVMLVALTVSIGCGVLFGLAPALRVPVRRLDRALRADARQTSGGPRRLQGGLVAAEIGLAAVLLITAGMLGRAMLRLSALDPGVSIRGVLAARVALSPGAFAGPEAMRAAWRDVVDRARSVPGVQAAALADIVPMRAGENTLPYSTGPITMPDDRLPVALASSVTPDYLSVMGIPLLRGRFLDDRDRLEEDPVVVVDEVLARRAFGDADPVGERLWIPAISRAPVRIVGEVAHVRHWGLARDDEATVRDQIYYPFGQVPDRLMRMFSTFMSLTVRFDGDPLRGVEPLRAALRGPANDQALYDVRTMTQLSSASLARQRFLLVLFGVFAGMALLLACIGTYGVLAYLTERRAPEMGVRMALGATSADVVGLVLRQSLGMVAAGVAMGAAGAFAASRLLVRLVDGVQPADPLTVAFVVSTLLAAALLASVVPARRASRLDALEALRGD